MQARVLGDVPCSGSTPSAARRSSAATGYRGLEAERFLRDVVGADQLREPALRAQPHPQRQQRVGSRVVRSGEQLAGGLLPQVQHQVAGGAAAEPAGDGRVGGDGDGVGQRRGGHAITVAPRLPRPCTSWPTDACCTACARAARGVHGQFGTVARTRCARARTARRYRGRVQVVQTKLDGVLLFEPTPHRDARGFFSRTSDDAVLAAAGIDRRSPGLPVAQRPRRDPRDARAAGAGRGQAGAVRARRGARRGRGRVRGRRRSAGGRVSRWTTSPCGGVHPRGFLHGFQALTDVADTCYRIDAVHDPSEDVGGLHGPGPGDSVAAAADPRQRSGSRGPVVAGAAGAVAGGRRPLNRAA